MQLEVLVLVSSSQLYHPQGSMTLLDFSPPLVSTKLYNSFFVQRHLLMPNAPESHVAFSPPFVVLIFLRWTYPCNNYPAPSLTVLNDIRRSGLSGASGQWRININKYKHLWLCTRNPLWLVLYTHHVVLAKFSRCHLFQKFSMFGRSIFQTHLDKVCDGPTITITIDIRKLVGGLHL